MKLLGGPWSKGDVFTAIGVLGVIAAILEIPGMPKLFHFDEPPVNAQSAPPTNVPMTFTGRVSSPSGKPIAGATVMAFQDQLVGQAIKADMDGQFQIQVAANTQSLRLVVDADGFVNTTVQADVHRTGPEEIVLQAVRPAGRSVKNVPVAPTPGPPVQTPGAPPSQPNQGIINNAPNQGIQNNCAPSVVNCDQSTHVEVGPPLPTANFLEHPLPSQDGAPDRPAINLVISVDHVFQLPAFFFECVEPCRLDGPAMISVQRGQAIMSQNVDLAGAWASKDSRHYTVLLSTPLSPRQGLVLKLTSFSSGIPKITGVVSVRPPD